MNMTKREKEFYNNLIICDEDKIRAEKSLQSKGVETFVVLSCESKKHKEKSTC